MARSLVDRAAEHRKIWGRIDCDQLPPRSVLVTGDEEVGKSTLVKSCLLTWSLRGHQVVYVDLRLPGRNLCWLDVLCQVRDALASWLPERAARGTTTTAWASTTSARSGSTPSPASPTRRASPA
jgi:GTPase SAR1 family protein